METTALVPITKDTALAIFNEKRVDEYLKAIEEDALNFVGDTTTDKGRKAIIAKAATISSMKVIIDDAGKKLNEDRKLLTDVVNEERKKARDFLIDLKAKVRKPVTDWEIEDKAKEDEKRRVIELEIEEERKAKELEEDWEAALVENDFFNRKKEVERKEAELKAQEEERIAKEKVLQAEKDQKERELKIAQNAKEKAEYEAAAKIDAIERARHNEELKRELEKKALEAAELELKQVEERKARNLNHQRKINREALEDFTKNSIDEELAKKIIALIAKGEIKHISIKY